MNYFESIRGGAAFVRPDTSPIITAQDRNVIGPAEALTLPAYSRLERNLINYGNTLSANHREALMCILGRFTMLAAGTSSGRFAYDLPCGGGKTQAVVAWCAELYHRKQPYSVMVCQTQVDHLCELKDQLIANGVPADAIGLVHTKGRDAKWPATGDNEEKQILLVTHQKVRHGADIREVNRYYGKPRDLVIWDESLIASDHMSVGQMQVDQALGWLSKRVEYGMASEALQTAVSYLDKAWGQIAAEFDRQRKTGSKAETLHLPELTQAELTRMVEALPTAEPVSAAKTLLTISQFPLRAVTSNQGSGGLIHYQIVVPPELKNVAVLDASWPIRTLQQLDKSLSGDPRFKGSIKSYGDLSINHMIHSSGRAAMTEEFTLPRGNRKVSKEIIHVVKDIPQEEGVLFFTFKKRGSLDIREKLVSDLKAAGVDVDAKLPNGKDRFAFLTWGQETSTSDYQYCTNVIFCGVLHRSDVDLAGAIAGQKDDLTTDLQMGEITNVQRSEIVHSLYQAINRAACRNTKDGLALLTNVWVIHHDAKIRKPLETLMPDLKWKTWEGNYLVGKTRKIETAGRQVADYLDGLDPFTEKVSFRRINDDLNLDVHKSVYHSVREVALTFAPEWKAKGRSMVRV